MTTMARLSWEADIAESTYRDHARSLEEARVNAELDKNQMSDVSVIQKATLNLKKAGPTRGILSVVGAMFAFSLGLLQAILRDSPVDSPSTPRRSKRYREEESRNERTRDSFRTEMDRDDVSPQRAIAGKPVAIGTSGEEIVVDDRETSDSTTSDSVAMTDSSSQNGQSNPLPR